MAKKSTYKDAGVNIKLGDEASRVLYDAAKETWKNRKGNIGEIIVPFDDFSGLRMINISGLPEGTMMCVNFDGIGTKVELAERMGDHSTMAFDLLAMVCDDAVLRGGEPVLVGSILDVNRLTDIKIIKQLAKGYVKAAKDANVAIINGELAELGNRVSGYDDFNYNWGAAVIWFAKKHRMFTGKEIKQGHFIVGLKENGFRSNGLSLVRKVFSTHLGENWHIEDFKGKKLGFHVLEPSRIYCKAIVDMFGGYNNEPKTNISGISHITGGGLPGKLGRVLKPSGLGATIDDPFEPCAAMTYCQELGGVEDEEAYKTWNMGQGMVIITPEPEKVIKIAKKHKIEAKVIGKVEDKKGIRINSKGAFSKGQLSFSPD